MKKHLPKAKAFYYIFDRNGIPPGLIREHIAYVKEALANLWDISPDAVRAETGNQLEDDATHRLTAYESKSRTNDEAMVIAAKAVLPHLRATKKRAAEIAAFIDAWNPGEGDGCQDAKALEYVANGYVSALFPAKRTWLISQCNARGLANPKEEKRTDAQLAALVLASMHQEGLLH